VVRVVELLEMSTDYGAGQHHVFWSAVMVGFKARPWREPLPLQHPGAAQSGGGVPIDTFTGCSTIPWLQTL
jgi:hypothetical protein